MAEVKITFLTTERVGIYLDKAVATGLYGMNRSDAAERMVASFIEDMLSSGTLEEIGTAKDEED